MLISWAFLTANNAVPGHGPSTSKRVSVGKWRQFPVWHLLTQRVSPGGQIRQNVWRPSHCLEWNLLIIWLHLDSVANLLSPFSMTASSSSGVLLNDCWCLFKKAFSLWIFAMLSRRAARDLVYAQTHEGTVNGLFFFYLHNVIDTFQSKHLANPLFTKGHFSLCLSSKLLKIPASLRP